MTNPILPTKAIIVKDGAYILWIPSQHTRTKLAPDDAKSIIFDTLLQGGYAMPGYENEFGIHIDMFEHHDLDAVTSAALESYGIEHPEPVKITRGMTKVLKLLQQEPMFDTRLVKKYKYHLRKLEKAGFAYSKVETADGNCCTTWFLTEQGQ